LIYEYIINNSGIKACQATDKKRKKKLAQKYEKRFSGWVNAKPSITWNVR
jgi:hypothetical protein